MIASTRIFGVLAVGGVLLVGCGGSEGTADIDLEFVAADGAAFTVGVVVGEDAKAVELSRLELQVREIKILTDAADEDDDDFKAKGTFAVDLLDAGNNSLSVALDPGNYKKVEFKIDKSDDGEGIDGTDASLWLEGVKGGIAFRYVDDKMDKITVRHVDGVDLEDGGSELLLVNLDVPSWLDGVDLATLDADANGLVVIDGSANKQAHDAIEENIKQVIKLVRKP